MTNEPFAFIHIDEVASPKFSPIDQMFDSANYNFTDGIIYMVECLFQFSKNNLTIQYPHIGEKREQ